MKFSVCLIVLIAISATNAEDIYNQGTRALLRVYDECSRAEFGMSACLKKKAITIIDRVARMDTFTVNDGFKIVKNQNVPELKPVSENELEQTLPRGIEARDEALTNLLVERIAKFFNARTFQIEFPKLSNEELGRSLEEGSDARKIVVISVFFLYFSVFSLW